MEPAAWGRYSLDLNELMANGQNHFLNHGSLVYPSLGHNLPGIIIFDVVYWGTCRLWPSWVIMNVVVSGRAQAKPEAHARHRSAQGS